MDILDPDEIGRVRLIKIDVEGAEPAIISNILDLLARFPDTTDFVVEPSPGDDAELSQAVFNRMMAAGFHAYRPGGPDATDYGLSHPLILELPVNCNRRLAFQLIDARYASPAACECTSAIVVSKAAGCQFVLFVRLFPDRREKKRPNSGR